LFVASESVLVLVAVRTLTIWPREGHKEAMKHTNVSGLKARLSEFLAAARRGETVEVRDRNTPIALLVPADAQGDLEVVEPSRPVGELRRLRAVPLRRKVDVVRLLRDGRDQR